MVAGAPATPSAYLASIPAARRGEVRRVHQLIRKAVPGLRPVVRSGMIGYGPFHYRYATGREGDTAIVGLAERKNGMSLYVLGWKDGRYLAEAWGPRLGKADCGRSCVRFRTLDDLDEKALTALLREAARTAKRTKEMMSP